MDNLWFAVSLIAIAARGHCGWSASIFSLMPDIFPRKTTASIPGICGFAGAVGGAHIAQLVGRLLLNSGMDGYVIPFFIASVAYFIFLSIIHILSPHKKPINL